MCIRVDFPDPDGPITAVRRPRSISRLTPLSASTELSPEPYVRQTSRVRRAASTVERGASGAISSADLGAPWWWPEDPHNAAPAGKSPALGASQSRSPISALLVL